MFWSVLLRAMAPKVATKPAALSNVAKRTVLMYTTMNMPRYAQHHLLIRGFAGKSKSKSKSGVKDKLVKLLKKEGGSFGGGITIDDKITVVGCGNVGIACCCFLLAQKLTTRLCLMDLRKEWVNAEADDFLHGSGLIGNPKIFTCTDGRRTRNSKFVIITAGARPKKGQSRLDVVQASADIMKKLIPVLVKESPKATFIIVANPADVMTYVAQKIGKLPRYRCFTTGCHLDSARFRYFISQRLCVAPSDVNGFIIGEHGESCVAAWSSVLVGGVPLTTLKPNIGTPCDEENWIDVHTKVKEEPVRIYGIKGYTNWSIAMAVADVIRAMKENANNILCLGTNLKGYCCITDDVVLSMPCVLNEHGISHVVDMKLTPLEHDQLMRSAETLLKVQATLKL